ncbi:hypothetical protein [Streptomyces cylindrosporus]|uniref:Uncharacterized protein n=1 Tax=Streptomyces cylindrosporus TaxID=2927583 RepID=A0ABS9YP77_9ACTN|nr:hypothetical protein [Streptomyces cylindrosporus]MCI3279067.1 hypothetical protein [Streptomyces cylindrosporus]
MSRRALLGYSGTTAAAAALGTTTSAQAADDETSTPEFPPDTEFSGTATLPDPVYSEGAGNVSIHFRVSCDTSVAGSKVDPIDVANALNAFLATRGWPAITFYGTPAPAALN